MTVAAMTCCRVAGDEAERQYLEALNVCFPAWGGREMFDWCFTRESAGLRPDLMTLHADGGGGDGDSGGPLAGTANTYRRIRLSNGQTLVAGIMTGSWTLPESRGLGAFTRLIAESRELAASRGAGLLLAFVTHTNASANRLRDAGAALFPTWYCRSRAERQVDQVDHVDVEVDVDGIGGVSGIGDIDNIGGPDDVDDVGDVSGVERGVRFVYTADEWRDQFILRPAGIMRMRSATSASAAAANAAEERDRTSRWSALVERTVQFDRVLSLSCVPSDAIDSGDTASTGAAWVDAIAALEARAAAANRRLFCFTSEARRASRLRARGFEIVDGYITALIANEAILRSACAVHGEASRVALSAHALADAASPWFLGGWNVRNGDRM